MLCLEPESSTLTASCTTSERCTQRLVRIFHAKNLEILIFVADDPLVQSNECF